MKRKVKKSIDLSGITDPSTEFLPYNQFDIGRPVIHLLSF